MLRDKSIAVLPFVNMSTNKENEFFCDGITEEIINALAKIDQLKVTSRTSSFYFKDHKIPITEIGEQLNVAAILEGSIRMGGDILRITAQLINVQDDSHFWSETWDRKLENILDIQDEISLLIAEKLREQYGHLEIPTHLVKHATQNLSAYENYLKGKHSFNKWNPEDVNKSIGFFEETTRLDDQLIEGYTGLADAYSFLAVAGFAPMEASWTKVTEAIKKAKVIDPDDASLNYILANQAFFNEADFSETLNYTLKAINSRPTYPEAHQYIDTGHKKGNVVIVIA